MSTFVISREPAVLNITVSGPATSKEIIAVIEREYPLLDGRSTLWDFTGSSVDHLTREDLEAIAAWTKNVATTGDFRKTAYVVADHATYVKACKYLNAAFSVGLPAEYAVFTSAAAAREWLGRRT